MAKPRVILTPSQIDRVKAMAAVELPLETVARQLDMARETLTSALTRQGLGEWMEEAFRRRRIYWLAREEFQSRYSDQAMMARHNISKTTLVRRQKQAYQQQAEQFRRAA